MFWYNTDYEKAIYTEDVIDHFLMDFDAFNEYLSEAGEDTSSQGIIDTIKKKIQELIDKIKELIKRFTASAEEEAVDQQLQEVNERYPKILKEHPELGQIDLSDHFHDTNLSIKDTARYEKETEALINKYINSKMSEEKFNLEFDKIRKKYIKDQKQLLQIHTTTSGEPTSKILLKGVLNALPSIIKVAGAVYIGKEIHSWAAKMGDKFNIGNFTDKVKNGPSTVAKAVSTVVNDVMTEAKDREKMKKRVNHATRAARKEFKGMGKFYGDVAKNVAGNIVKSVKKESTLFDELNMDAILEDVDTPSDFDMEAFLECHSEEEVDDLLALVESL
jgi:hypothetical protein